MISGPLGGKKYSSLMNEYASLLGDAVLRHRARTAEHSARTCQQTEIRVHRQREP